MLQNVLSLAFGDNTRTVRTGAISVGYNVLGAFVTDVQLITLLVCALAFVLLIQFLDRTRLGRAIRGVFSNAELCGIVGIEVERTILWAVGIGSALAGLGGVLSALDTDMTPSMGFRLLMNGVIVFIIGGVGSYRAFSVVHRLTLRQHGVAYFSIVSGWMRCVPQPRCFSSSGSASIQWAATQEWSGRMDYLQHLLVFVCCVGIVESKP